MFHCNNLQHIARHCNTSGAFEEENSGVCVYMCATATHCNTLLHTYMCATATHCNTLQHTATHLMLFAQPSSGVCVSQVCYIYIIYWGYASYTHTHIHTYTHILPSHTHTCIMGRVIYKAYICCLKNTILGYACVCMCVCV